MAYAPLSSFCPSRRWKLAERGELGEPTGWFAVATARELLGDRVRPSRIGHHELVVWRSVDGQARVADAQCPHMGAHLGDVGSLKDGNLVCGFHGFSFDGDGACVSTGYGGRVPPRACLKMWPSIEVDGVVLAWRHPEVSAPSWTVAPADASGWTRPQWNTSSFAGHPMEITENSVDLGHLQVLHGYASLDQPTSATADGPLLRASYSFSRPWRLAWPPAPTLDATIEVSAYGLGFSRVELHVATIGARFRLWVLPTLSGDGHVTLRLGAAARLRLDDDAPGPLRRFPPRLSAPLLRGFTLAGLVGDVAQDRKVWRSKRHLSRPALAPGDGPIGLYRQWAKQFFALPDLAASPDPS